MHSLGFYLFLCFALWAHHASATDYEIFQTDYFGRTYVFRDLKTKQELYAIKHPGVTRDCIVEPLLGVQSSMCNGAEPVVWQVTHTIGRNLAKLKESGEVGPIERDVKEETITLDFVRPSISLREFFLKLPNGHVLKYRPNGNAESGAEKWICKQKGPEGMGYDVTLAEGFLVKSMFSYVIAKVRINQEGVNNDKFLESVLVASMYSLMKMVKEGNMHLRKRMLSSPRRGFLESNKMGNICPCGSARVAKLMASLNK